jgi:hypothetical protein
MLVSLWLQHPYFSGTSKILTNVMTVATEIKNRESKRLQGNRLEVEDINKEKLDRIKDD